MLFVVQTFGINGFTSKIYSLLLLYLQINIHYISGNIRGNHKATHEEIFLYSHT